MERKQKRGWLKFALTTAMALAFMGVMAVTAMAGTHATVRMVPAEVSAAHRATLGTDAVIGIDVYVDFVDGQNLGALTLNLTWDPALLNMVRVRRTGPVEIYDSVWAGEWWNITGAMQPGADTIALGDVTIGGEGVAVGTIPSTGTSTDSLLLSMIFELVDDEHLGNITMTVAFDDAAEIVAHAPVTLTADALTIPPTVVVVGGQVGWGFHNFAEGSPERAFITAVTEQGSVAQQWFTHLHNVVWPAADTDTIYQAYALWLEWIAAEAAAA